MSTELNASQLNQRIAEYHGYQFLPMCHPGETTPSRWEVIYPDGKSYSTNQWYEPDKLYLQIRTGFVLPYYTDDDSLAMGLLYSITDDWDMYYRDNQWGKGYSITLFKDKNDIITDADLCTVICKVWLKWKESSQK